MGKSQKLILVKPHFDPVWLTPEGWPDIDPDPANISERLDGDSREQQESCDNCERDGESGRD